MNRPTTTNKSEEVLPEVTLRDMAAPLFRHRRLVIITFSSVFLCAVLFAFGWAARYYVATMQVVVEQDRSDPAIGAGQSAAAVSSKPVTTDQVSSELALLQGMDMLRSVAATCGLAKDHTSISDVLFQRTPEERKARSLESATRTLAKKLKVEAESTSDVIDVKYGQTGEPTTPACVLQNLSKLYLEKHLQLRRPAGSSGLFGEEVARYQQALTESETRLADFSRQEGVASPDVLRTDTAQQVSMSEAALHQARQMIAADSRRLENLKAQMAKTPARSSTAEVSNSSNLLMQNLQADLLAAQIKKAQLLVKYDPSYPLVREADQEIAATQEAITKAGEAKYVNQTTDRDLTFEFLRQDEAKTQADLASQEATAAALSDSIKSMRMEMVKLDSEAVNQGALIREAKANEGNYLLYLTKREQERTSDALDKKRIANVAIAVPAVVPVLPEYGASFVILLGFILALFASVGAAVVAEYLDPSFRTPSEVAEALSIPVLASVPRRAA
jgi:uncharacterized protein involved in exopolysaccharide biosynthesis